MDEIRTTSNRYDFMAVVLAKFDFMVDAEADAKVIDMARDTAEDSVSITAADG